MCEIDLGTPTSEIVWERQGRTIRPSDRVSSTITGNRCLLTINDCNVEDIGLYKVTASNKLGTVECEADLNVSSKYKAYVK